MVAKSLKNIYLLLILTSLSYSTSLIAQSNTAILTGTIRTKEGEAAIGASVTILAIGKGTITDWNGNFKLNEIPYGNYQLEVKYLGYKSYQITIRIAKAHEHISAIDLEEEHHEMSEVTITAKSETQQVKEQTIKAEVVDTKAVKEQPVSLTEVMNRTAGIRVRQTGGLGSSSNMLINGYQGRSIKYFKDGVPMDYLGAGYDISFVPVNMLDRAEVYKGVLPAKLGADALGGAVNFITKKALPKYAEASYEIASYNTHRASLNAFIQNKQGKAFLGMDAFFNHSDNDYTATVTVRDPVTAAAYRDDVRLFHNKFSNYYAEVYGGFTQRKWADELRLGFTGFLINRQNQFGTTMNQPFGAATNRQYSLIPTLHYRKSFWNQKLQFDQFFVANTIHSFLTDTAHGLYDWYGHFRPIASRVGEMTVQGSASDIRFNYKTSRTNVLYQLHPNHQLNLSVVYIGLSREGSDPYGTKFKTSQKDILSVPAVYNKFVSSLGLESKLLKERISNALIVKYYHYKTSYTEASMITGEESSGATSNSKWGLADAIKLKIRQNSFIRLSAEVATRLPEQDEIFGDGNYRLSNFELKPERSVNANLGFRTEKPQKFSFEVNTFYRITQDLILNVAPVNFIFSQYQNVDNVKGIGLETDAKVSLTKWLTANGNFTCQDFRIFNTGNRVLENSRLKNTPFFFANLGLNSNFKKLFDSGDKFQVYWYYTFVRQYYLDYIPPDYEPGGFLGLWGKANFQSNNIIPDQNIQSAGVTYFFRQASLSFMIKNLLNAKVYDNFRIQNAGRSFHLKLNVTIK